MSLIRIDHEHVTTLAFNEEEQLRDAEAIREYLNEIIEEGRIHILFDLENVTYVSSSVLGCFITTFQQLEKKGGKLKITNVRPNVVGVFEMTRLDRIIEILQDRETAYRSFGIQSEKKSPDIDEEIQEIF